jgi:hypothetical protein
MEGRGGKLMFAVINFISFNTQYTQNKKDMISYDFDIQVSIFLEKIQGLCWVMVINATFNNISVISWWSISLVEETGVPGENH